ncbi:MAG: PD-(D/E)XK nuclease family protein [Deferribacteraceae bacterium]|nr:PD-(D/E)XK nuclease family protein [Deferribacteraceae bacterium]
MHKIPERADPLLFMKERLLELNFPYTAVIVPTNRNLRKLASCAKWELDIQTVAEFTRRTNLYTNIILPKELRKYYLYKAAKNLTETEQSKMLHSGESDALKSYLNFVQSSSDLLPFYRELNVEGIDAETLKNESAYSEYKDQITSLANLWRIYCNSLRKEGFVDEWEYFSSPSLDEKYLLRYKNYFFLIGGYLNKYEITQLRAISEKYRVELYFNYTGEEHYQKDKLENIFNAKITGNENTPPVRRRIVNTGTFSDNHDEPVTEISPCANVLAQFDLITKRICELHFKNGVQLNKIAVVLPTQELAPLFLESDPYCLYNVSAGRPFTSYNFYETLSTLREVTAGTRSGKIPLELLEQLLASPCFYSYGTEAFYSMIGGIRKKGAIYIDTASVFNFRWKGAELLYTMLKPFNVPYMSYSDCIKTVSEILKALEPPAEYNKPPLKRNPLTESSVEKETEGLHHAADELEKLLLLYSRIKEEFPPPELLSGLLNGLAELTVPVRNGEVSVLGLLESRNMQYDYIFIPGMNSGSFPARHGKDLFLNSELRRQLQLPTAAAREALQKSYCNQIMARAKYTLITYSAGEENQPSAFIQELLSSCAASAESSELPVGNKLPSAGDAGDAGVYEPADYIIFPSKPFKTGIYENGGIIKDSNVIKLIKSFEFSATSLSCYRDCPLQFFYRYVKKLRAKEESVNKTDMRVLGSVMHSVMETLFKERVSAADSAYLDRMNAVFDEKISGYDYFTSNPIGVFHVKGVKSSFPGLVRHEKARLESGAVIQAYEWEINCKMYGFRFKGKIDRWDSASNGYDIVDYKYKNIEEQKPQKEECDDTEGAEKYFDKTDLQLPLYALIMGEHNKSYPENMLWFDLKGGQGFIHGFYKESIGGFRNYLEKVMTDIAEPDVPFRNARESVTCEYCEYNSFCHGSLL